VKNNINTPIPVTVIRNQNDHSKDLALFEGKKMEIVKLNITPRKWDGPGVLGYDYHFKSYLSPNKFIFQMQV
jgi:hypothetical protein